MAGPDYAGLVSPTAKVRESVILVLLLVFTGITKLGVTSKGIKILPNFMKIRPVILRIDPDTSRIQGKCIALDCLVLQNVIQGNARTIYLLPTCDSLNQNVFFDALFFSVCTAVHTAKGAF
jgi:hypothetical protein